MKNKFLISLLLIGNLASGADNSMVYRGIDELQLAQQQTRVLMNGNLSPQDRERVRYIDQRLSASYTWLWNSLNQPGQPYPPPGSNSTIELFHSDNCSTELIGRVNFNTNCSLAFSGSPMTWGVRIDGVCYDAADIPSENACEIYKDARPQGVKLFQSDNCSEKLVAIVDPYFQCQKLINMPRVWGIQVGGKCNDISDSAAEQACERFKQ